MPGLAPRVPALLPVQWCRRAAQPGVTVRGLSPGLSRQASPASCRTVDCGAGVCSLCRGATIAVRDVEMSVLGLCCLQLSQREPLVVASIERGSSLPAPGGKRLLPVSCGMARAFAALFRRGCLCRGDSVRRLRVALSNSALSSSSIASTHRLQSFPCGNLLARRRGRQVSREGDSPTVLQQTVTEPRAPGLTTSTTGGGQPREAICQRKLLFERC